MEGGGFKLDARAATATPTLSPQTDAAKGWGTHPMPAALLCLFVASCSGRQVDMSLTEPALENAREATTRELGRAVVADPRGLERVYRPLGQRIGVLQVRSRDEWHDLEEAIPGLGPSPDFSRGIVVGVVSRLGQPMNGDWPLSLDWVRVERGGGYVSATFEGGTYLPDGTCFVDLAHVEGLKDVLMVDVNGVRFYP